MCSPLAPVSTISVVLYPVTSHAYDICLATMGIWICDPWNTERGSVVQNYIKTLRVSENDYMYTKSWRYLPFMGAQITSSEKAMATHSSTLAWKIPWMEEPGRLQSMGLLRVGHDWATSLSLFTFMHWRRKWQPTPVFLPGESQRRGSLVGYCLWGHRELDTPEAT